MYKRITIGDRSRKVLDFISKILATLTVLLIAFLYANAVFGFGLTDAVLQVLYMIREYAILGIVVLVGLEFCIDKGFVIFVLYCLIAAVAVIFSFFPQVAAQLIGLIGK